MQTFSIGYYATKHIDFRYTHQQSNIGTGIWVNFQDGAPLVFAMLALLKFGMLTSLK